MSARMSHINSSSRYADLYLHEVCITHNVVVNIEHSCLEDKYLHLKKRDLDFEIRLRSSLLRIQECTIHISACKSGMPPFRFRTKGI